MVLRRVRWMVRLGVLLVLFLVAFAFAAIVASTGIVRLPGFGWAYEPPAPLRVVRTGAVYSPEEFRRLVETRTASTLRATPAPVIRIAFTESELTAFLRGSIREALRDPSVEARDLQIAIEPSHLEFSGRFRRGWLQMDVLAEADVVVQDEAIQVRMRSIRIGKLPATEETVRRLLSNVLARDVGSFEVRVGELPARQIELFPGRLEIAITSSQP